MAYRRIKDRTKLIKQWTLKAGGGFYFHVYLWEDIQSYRINNGFDNKDRSVACANSSGSFIDKCHGAEVDFFFPKLGEAHFVKDLWNIEIIVHELDHLFFQLLRTKGRLLDKVMYAKDVKPEEPLCRLHGMWVGDLYRALWKINPYPGKQEEEK